VAVLERDKPILVFFETLESSCGDGLVQRYNEAHERRPCEQRGQDSRGEILRGAKRLREARPVGVG